MLITQTTIVTFDPVEEYNKMILFEAENPDWEKKETTVEVSYIRTIFQIVTDRGEENG